MQSKILSQISGVRHGFGNYKNPKTWDSPLPSWKQVHGNSVIQVLAQDQICGEVDGVFTSKAGVSIAVVSADCVPVLLAKKDGSIIAAVHSGWRGTKARILEELFRRLSDVGERPQDWVAAVGPAIGPCCYEVSEELAEEFRLGFSSIPEAQVTPTRRHLDLQTINSEELKRLGISEVEILRHCTRCAQQDGEPLFHSYRREGGGVRQYSMIEILPILG